MELILKRVNRKDGKGKDVKKFPLRQSDISKKQSTMICSNCKQQGIRTIGWHDELYACKNIECDVRWYWKMGVYYV